MSELVFWTVTYFASVVLMYFVIRFTYSKGSSSFSTKGATFGDFMIMICPILNTMAVLGVGGYELWTYLTKTKKLKFNFNKFFGVRRD